MQAGARADAAPLVAHVIYRLGVGGLENGLVNLINHLPADDYRHAIICLTEHTDFRRRIRRPDVELVALGKKPGLDPRTYLEFWRVLRRLRPDIVHTRNLATVDCQFVALAAGVPCRVHGEHGWDIHDPHGRKRRHRLLRRAAALVVDRFITMSRDLAGWLSRDVGIRADRITQIYSGVDSARFHPRSGPRGDYGPPGFAREDSIVVGTVGRLDPVKDPLTLVRAFRCLRTLAPDLGERLRLVVVGDGALRGEVEREIARAGMSDVCWTTGARDDVPELMRGMDVFALSSLNEGVSNTILEAMASGLPVVATRVGGNVEIVEEGFNGALCPPSDPEALARALLGYVRSGELRRAHGANARARVLERFTMEGMVRAYARVYSDLLRSRRVPQRWRD